MTLQEALEMGGGRAISNWRAQSLEQLIECHKQPIGKIVVLQCEVVFTIIAKKFDQKHIDTLTRDIPGWDELCMEVTGPPYMALTLDGWEPVTRKNDIADAN